MYLDPVFIQWLLIGGTSLCAFMMGKSWSNRKTEDIIENTISYMVENNFVRYTRNEKGEIDLIPLDE